MQIQQPPEPQLLLFSPFCLGDKMRFKEGCAISGTTWLGNGSAQLVTLTPVQDPPQGLGLYVLLIPTGVGTTALSTEGLPCVGN